MVDQGRVVRLNCCFQCGIFNIVAYIDWELPDEFADIDLQLTY